MTTNLINAMPARERILVGKDHEFFATFTFNPPKMADAERAPLDIAVALDVSGSMSGPKIEAAKQSLLKLVEHLKGLDRLCLVTFTTHVETVFSPMLMTVDNKATAKAAIANLYAQSSTNLSGGLFKALDHLKEADPIKGAVRRCMVFTDGLANAGITDMDKLATATLEYRDGIGISTFGYGQSHNEVLLEAISQDGSFYYIDTPDKILTAFGSELGGLISTYAQNVVLTLTPGEGVKIAEVLNDLTVKEEDGKVIVECDDLLAEQEYSVVVKLAVEKRDNAHPRATTLVTGDMTYFDVGATKKAKAKASLQVQFVKAGKESTEDNDAVLNAVTLQKAIQAQNEAIKLADAGDYAGSQAVMYAASADIRCIGGSHALGLSEIGEGLARENFTAESYAAGGSSEARSMTKGMKSRRRVAVRSKGGVSLDAFYGGNDAQDQMAEEFAKGDDDAKGGKEPKPSKSDESVSKSRSGRSW